MRLKRQVTVCGIEKEIIASDKKVLSLLKWIKDCIQLTCKINNYLFQVL